MVGEGGKPDDDLAVAESGNFVADGFSGGGREGGTDGGAHFLQGGVGWFGDGGEVGVDGFWRGAGFGLCCRSVFARFWLFHARETTKRVDESPRFDLAKWMIRRRPGLESLASGGGRSACAPPES